MEEQLEFLRAKANELDLPLPDTRVVHSDRRGGVADQIEAAARDFAHAHHAVVFITHEGLRIGDLAQFAGWHARIDEIPDTIVSGSFKAGAGHRHLAPTYRLVSVGDGKWWHVEPKNGGLQTKEVLNDTAATPLAHFHKAVRSQSGVFVDIGDWLDVKGQGRDVRWWSLWTPLALETAASVKIACAGFDHSLCYHVMKSWFSDRATFENQIVGGDMPRAQPEVCIHYFTEGHTGTTEFWDTSDGRGCLNKIARYLEKIGGVGYWSGNENVQKYMEHWFPGTPVKPKLAGTNSLIEHTSCAMIYSNKPQKGDDAILEIFDLSKNDIKQAREIEDVVQFVMRGAIRKPEFAGNYTIYVYDRAQAEALANRLRDGGLSENVAINPVLEAGILEYERPKTGRSQKAEKLDLRSHKERKAESLKKGADRSKRYRQKKSDAAKAAGTWRGPGRPAKTSLGVAQT
jgi:hypothetical protein